MKRTAVVLAVLAALTLTGCAGTPEAAPSEPETITTVTTDETPAPLVAETPAAIDDAEAEAAFLVEVRERLGKINTQIPDATDEQLLAAAADACERLDAGESSEAMSLIEDEKISDHGYYSDSAAIITSATLTICPITE